MIIDLRTRWLLEEITCSNLGLSRSPFLVIGKQDHDKYLRLWKFSLHLKFKLHHETFLMLTHISTALTIHWGNRQLDRAKGLGSFVSGKEFGSSTCSTSTVYSETHNVSLKGFSNVKGSCFSSQNCSLEFYHMAKFSSCPTLRVIFHWILSCWDFSLLH